ncbi:MAG: hypothetical protein IPO66_09840 [Rhodanobacteraceae bacterium]|nr:hypothetical protein [Rhodanobacteraceae bacterium]
MSEHANPTLPNPALVLLLPAAACSAALTAAVARVTGASVHLRPPQQAWRDEISALRQEFPEANLLRVREAQLWLADDALLRLLKAAAAATGPVTTTTNADPQLVPAAPDCELDGSDPAALDQALHVLSGRQLLALAATEPALVALAADAPADAGLLVADHVYAHVTALPVRGLSTPADRRERAPAHVLAPLRRALLRAGGPLAAQWPQPGRDQRPVLLHILHGWGGGAERFVRDLASTDAARHHLLLRAVGNPSRRLHGEFLELSDARGGPPLRRLLLSPAIGAIVDRHPGYREALDALIADFCIEQSARRSVRRARCALVVGHRRQHLQRARAKRGPDRRPQPRHPAQSAACRT